jgi:hypothetical protein
MRKIALLATGGTIASVQSPDGLTPGVNAEELIGLMPQLRDGGEITCRIPFSFIEKMFSYEVEKGTPSVRVRLNTKTNEILIRQVIYTNSEKPLPVHFSIDCFDMIAN